MILSSAMRCLVSALALSLMAAPLPASSAPQRKLEATGAKAPLAANNGIIPLPLNPVIPPAQRLCTQRTPSQLGYTVLRPATGPMPGGSDLVLVNYIGYLAATGTVFDQGMRSVLSVDGVIPGFAQGLQMMARTSIARICIPAEMGYGAQDAGSIPPNSDLVFQIELVDYRPRPAADGTPGAPASESSEQSSAAPQP